MPGWALDIHEAELSFKPPPSPADVPNSDILWVQLRPQGTLTLTMDRR